MRKKFVKSSRPTYKKRIRKAQQGMRFVNYNVVENPTIDYKDITNPTNPFSEYNFNTTYDKPEVLVVPEREDSKPDTVEETPVVANNPTVEPVVNKPVTKTAKSTWKSPYTNRKQWTTELINAYKKAGITNDNAIRMLLAQDALESSWGKSAQGKYNFGNLTTGSSWKGDYVTGNDKNAKGEAIKQKFRSYNSMDEYAADKIQFLKRLYDFDENDDINKFVAKLTGSNKGKRRYAEASNYAKVLTGIYNGIPKGQGGLVIQRDAIKDYRPVIPTKQKLEYYIRDLGGKPSNDITYEQRWERQKKERTIEDWKNLLRGLNNTAGRAASLTSLLYGGGWAATRLLSGNKSTAVGQVLSKYVLPSNTYDTVGDVCQLIEDPSVSNVVEVGVGMILGKWKDFGKKGRQMAELGSQALNAYNSYKSGGIIKYQNPAQPIARRDATYIDKPNVPNRIRRATSAERIQSMINIYGQSEQPVVTSDTKSPWQHQQAQVAASKGYDDYMQAKKYEEGLHNLNGFLTFTDYATLVTGLGSLLSKGASMAGKQVGKQMAKRAVGKEFKRQSKHLATPANNSLLVDMSGVTPRPLSEFSSLSDAELAKLLPDYAHPNWQGDGFKLVKERLWNGGFDRLEKYGDISRYSPQQRTIILNSNPKIETSATLGEQPGTGAYRETYSINKDVLKDYNLQQSSSVKAHEMVHYMYRPSKEQEAEFAYNVRQYFKRPEGRDYFRKSRATEQTARGTQIKNYYGLNEGSQDITPAMWEYARRNYVKDTGINNNMTEWLNSVDERDISAFVKWLSNNAPIVAAPLIGGTMYGNKDSK